MQMKNIIREKLLKEKLEKKFIKKAIIRHEVDEDSVQALLANIPNRFCHAPSL